MDPELARQRRAQRRAKQVVIVNHEKDDEQFTRSAPVQVAVPPDHICPTTDKAEPLPSQPRIEAPPPVLPLLVAPVSFWSNFRYVTFAIAFILGLCGGNYSFLALWVIDFIAWFSLFQLIRECSWSSLWLIGAVIGYFRGAQKRYPPYVVLAIAGRLISQIELCTAAAPQ